MGESDRNKHAGVCIRCQEIDHHSGRGIFSALYPFAGLSCTRRLRLSLTLPLFLPILVVLAGILVIYSYTSQDLTHLLPLSMALLGAMAGMIAGAVWMMLQLAPFQSPQFVFARTGGALWRVDLAKLNQTGTFRFSTKTGAFQALRWEILTQEEQQRAQSAITRAIRSIHAGEVMPDSMLRRAILYLPNPRVEQENKWVWKISYALDTGADGRRKAMTIGKVYPGFTPAPGATPSEGPVPARWSYAVFPLALTLILALAGWGIGSSLFGHPDKGGTVDDVAEVHQESVVPYEDNGIR